MAAIWSGWRMKCINNLTWSFSSSRVGLNNPKIVMSCLNPCKNVITTECKTWIPHQAKLFHTQCRQPVLQQFKLPGGDILRQTPCEQVNATNCWMTRGLFVTIPHQAKLFHMQYRQPVLQQFKLLCGGDILCQKVNTTNTWISRGLFATARKPLLSGRTGNQVSPRRGITMVSKKGKRKTCKAVAKRFIRTGKGKLKRWRCGKHHLQSKKSSRRKRFLRKPTYASKTQLKTLNKMLNGW